MEPARAGGGLAARMDRAAALKLLESQHRFPSDHAFHVIVRGDPDDVAHVTAAVIAHGALEALGERLRAVPSAQGRYLSLRLSLPCADAEAVLEWYGLFARLERVVRYF